MNWVEIPAHFLSTDRIQRVALSGKTFCLAFWDGKYVAFSLKCPHAKAPLYQGWIAEGYVVCAYHRQRFDLQTGKGEVGQGNFIDIYPTKEIDNKWYVGLKKSFWQKIF